MQGKTVKISVFKGTIGSTQYSAHVHNSLAEIQRLCNKVQQKYTIEERPNKRMLLNLGGSLKRLLSFVPHPSENFFIYSNAVYYLVIDNGMQTVYKLRQ